MKAFVRDRYGPPDVLSSAEIDRPALADDQLLVRVRAASANAADWHMLRGDPYLARTQLGLRKPKVVVLGADLAGEVVATGKTVTRFQPGDEVFGEVLAQRVGAFAEYTAVPQDHLGFKPANLSFEQAATLPVAALTALQAVRDHGKTGPGDKVLIIGASGGVGTFAVQIAKALGAEVTGVCSTRNLDMVRSIGADHVIDYTKDDFTESRERYDLILQAAGTQSPSACRRVLSAKGRLVMISGDGKGHWLGPIERVVRGLLLSLFVKQKLMTFVEKPNEADLQTLKELTEAGKITPVIDRTYSLSEVPEAVRYVEEGHTQGKVVVTVAPES